MGEQQDGQSENEHFTLSSNTFSSIFSFKESQSDLG